MKRTLGIVIAGGLIALSACQKVIHLNLNSTAAQIDIQGNVTNATGPYTVYVSQSVDFYSTNTYPGISGAVVKMTDSTLGITDSLTETITPGIYATHFLQGVSGHTYTLYVLTGGTTYTASSTMPAPVQLDSITYSTTSFGSHQDIQPIPNFQDPPGVPNYYQFQLIVNGFLVQKTFVFDDEFSDGRYIHEPLQTDTSDVHAGDALQLNMYCIDENIYNYFNELVQITDPNAQSQNAAPANPTSNITGGCLGYFSAHTISSLASKVP